VDLNASGTDIRKGKTDDAVGVMAGMISEILYRFFIKAARLSRFGTSRATPLLAADMP